MPAPLPASAIPQVAYGTVPAESPRRSPMVIAGGCVAALLAAVLIGMLTLGRGAGDEEGLAQVAATQETVNRFLGSTDGDASIPRFAADDPAAYLRLQSGWLLSQATDPESGTIWALTQGPRVATSPLTGEPVDDERAACPLGGPGSVRCFQVPGHPTATVLVASQGAGASSFVTIRDNVSDTWFLEARTGLRSEDLPQAPARFAASFLDGMVNYEPGQFSAEEIFVALGGSLDS